MDKSIFQKAMKRYGIWALLGVLIVAAVLVFVLRSTSQTTILRALSVDGDGRVAPDSAFELTAKAGQELDSLREAVVVEPEFSYDLVKTDSGIYQITPLKLLDAGAKITFTVSGQTFHFEVQNRLQPVSVFPVDGRRNVPVDSGVEFTFNTQNLTQEAFEAAFSITPDVNGSFAAEDRRYVFYPADGLAYGTEYSVTLAAGLAAEDGAALEEALQLTFTTISEQEESLRHMFQISGGVSVNSLTSESPLIQVYIDKTVADPDQSITVALHAYDSAESYRKALQTHTSRTRDTMYDTVTEIDVEGLREHAAFEVVPIPSQTISESDSGSWVLQFPSALQEGWYAATFSLQIDSQLVQRQLFLQVSDLSVFYMAQGKDLLAWINDASTGLPVEGAEVEIAGSYRAQGITGADGTVHIVDAVPPEEDRTEVSTYLTVEAGERIFVDTDLYYTYDGDGGMLANNYMSYVFTDRPLYHTTDIVQVWGMVRPRSVQTALPADLKLVLGDEIATQAVTPLPNGTYTATLHMENTAANSWMPLRLMAGEEELFYQSLRVEDFVKPIYTAKTAPEKPVYLLEVGDVFRVGVDVSTFDGTPISDFGINLGSWSGSLAADTTEFRTDRQGHVNAAVRVEEDVDTWYPQHYYYEFYSSEAQDEGFYLYGDAYGIHRDVMLAATPDLESGGQKVEVTTHRIDISQVQTPEQIWERDILRGEALSIPVKATINKVYYERIKTGTHYDFISRTSVDTYEYERREEVVDTQEFSTTGGSYTLEGLPVSDGDTCYFVQLEATDAKGRTVRTTAYLGDIYSRYGSRATGTHRYTLVKQANPAYSVVSESNSDVRIEPQLAEYEDGETVEFLLMDNDQPMEAMQGRLLCGVVQGRFSNIAVSNTDRFSLPFSDALLPNYVVTGAYFDGKHVFALENTNMLFNPRRRELDIALKPDKESYRPSEAMRVEATVTNAVTGKPATDTEVVISVVDEAVFAIQEQYTDILNRIYEMTYFPYVRKYTSYLQLDFGGPGEKGGGGDQKMRTEFEDTAYFATGTTDSAGKVRFDCKLPDNITSWRLSSLALSPENHAGNAKTNVVTTKEFFILPVVNDMLLEGDDFAVGAYGTGSQVKDSDEVRYTITIEGEGRSETKEITTTLREYAGAQFGGLTTGDYTVSFAAECGGFSDGVRLPFSVVRSGVEVSLVKTFHLKNGISVDSLRYPVNIAFYGQNSKTYNTVFGAVYDISTGGRADMRLARRYVASRFQKQGADWYNTEVLKEDYADISGSSVFSLFPYSERDLELTAKARLALPEMVSIGGLQGLTAANTSEYAGAKTAVYLANVLAGESPSANLRNMLENGADLDYVDKMYLVLALALSGETEQAKGWYDVLVAPNLAELTGLSGDTALYVNTVDSARSQADCTAAASLLATALSTDDAAGLARYLAEKKTAYEPYLFEQIYYLNKNELAAGGSASFSYTRNGKTETVALNSALTTIPFTREQLDEAAFMVRSGDVYADVYYAGSPDQTADMSQKKIGFNKTIEPVGGSYAIGGLVKVTLTPNFSALDADIGDTMLVVDDYIPTGMRFERYDHDSDEEGENRGWYLNSRQGQRLQYTVYGVGHKGVKPLVYYVRCTTLGEYIVESAYITSSTGEIWGASDRAAVTIP